MRSSVLLVVLFGLFACSSKTDDKGNTKDVQTAPSTAENYLDQSPEDCSSCHPAIVSEWSKSMHSNSTAAKDPLFALMLAKAKAASGDRAERDCMSCHNPLHDFDAPGQVAMAIGVSCAVCHETAHEHPRKKLITGTQSRFDVARSPSGTAQALCLSCHAQRDTGAGIPICVTGPENHEVGEKDCVQCHMPVLAGAASVGVPEAEHRSHFFPGGHDPAWVRGAAQMKLSVEKEMLFFTIEAAQIGHRLPTGTPLRHIVLDVQVYNAKGVEIWRNRAKDAHLLAERDSVFMRAFANKKGKAPVPPFMSTGVPSDNRLHAGKGRVVRYPVPKGGKRVKATLRYFLAPSPILEEAAAPDSWKMPVVMAEIDQEL